MKELSGFCWGFTRLSSLTSSPKTGSGSFGRAGWTTAWPSSPSAPFSPSSRRRSRFALGASALHRAAVRAFASSAFVPSAFAGLYDARVVRRHILVGHTGIRGSRRGAVGSPRSPKPQGPARPDRRERDRQKRDTPPPHERSFGRGRGTREATTSTIRANSVRNSKRPAHIWKI